MNECTDVSLHERGIIGVWIEIGGGSVFCGVVRQKARQTSSQTFVPGISRHSFCRECWGLAWGVEEGIWEPGITRGSCMKQIQDVLNRCSHPGLEGGESLEGATKMSV